MSGDGAKVFDLSLSRRSAVKAGMLGAADAAWLRALPRSAGAAAAQGAPGGTLVIGKPYEVNGLDPTLQASQTSWEINAVVYESLIFLDENLAPAPGLAESWTTPDDRTYVFKIREGVKFHNGAR